MINLKNIHMYISHLQSTILALPFKTDRSDRLFWAMWSELIGWIACCWLDVPLCGYMRIRSWTGYAGAAAAVMAIIITYRTSANWKGRLPCEC